MRTLISIPTFFICLLSYAQPEIIPSPQHIKTNNSSYTISTKTPIVINSPKLKGLSTFLRQEILKNCNISLTKSKSLNQGDAIKLNLTEENSFSTEGYKLKIDKNSIQILAAEKNGIFNGIISLLQVIRQSKNQNNKVTVEGIKIKDSPKHSWRGLMLDTSRYFISKEKLKDLIDWMAFYKLNKLHLHLTDEPAWRIEIKKYPKLALVGGIGDYNKPYSPAKFYSQEDIKEIVAYANKRFIQVIPEIDMPGHATAANKAYPEYSGGGSKNHPEFTFNPGLEATYSFLSDILKETNVLFPSNMLHLGGDEVSYGNEKWEQNESIKMLMKKENIKKIKGVEKYFMKRMADSVYDMGAELLVWDEMATLDLRKDKTYIFWWRHDKPEQLNTALKKGYKTILCPRLPLYLDFVQDDSHKLGRRWGGNYNTLKKIYHFSVEQWIEKEEYSNHIIGIQGNLWTETVTSDKRLEYLLFPRVAAVAETAWSTNNNFEDFQEKIKAHLKLYKTAGIYFYDPFNKDHTPEPVFIR